jgi:hypothetical protein
MASASRPAHFISKVRRMQRRDSASVARSSPSLSPFSRGSSSDGLPSALNMSARRVVAMAAIIGDAHGGRQGINDTLKSIAPASLSQVTSPPPVISSSIVRPLARNDSCRHSGPPQTTEVSAPASPSWSGPS